VTSTVDIAVVGAGSAGIAAAVSAARAGCSTLLIDQSRGAGGTGGFSGLTTLCGLYDDEGEMLNEGFTCEFAVSISESAAWPMGKVWVLPYRPIKFREVAQRLLTTTQGLQTSWNTTLREVTIENKRIVALNRIGVGAVIDCSGSAEAARLAGAECLATDETTQSPAVVFPLRHVTRDMNSPVDAAQVMLPLARAGFRPVNFQQSLEANTLTVKFTGTPEQVPELISFLQNNISGFENCSTRQTQFQQVNRAGRMIVGRYVLTCTDVLGGRKFPDAVARCAWPIEQWNEQGLSRLRYLAPGTHYEIPPDSLRAAGIENLFMGGKTISADVDAIASARVMGCCLATGAAAGNLAADYLKSART